MYLLAHIELHGNHYGPDLGYKPKDTLRILGDNGIKVAAICGMFSPDNDLSSNRAIQRQAAIDYIRRELDCAVEVGAGYMLLEESHLGEAIIDAGDMLTNLHMADSNRCALGAGSMDLDTIIMALYMIGYNQSGCFCTPEPLGPGRDPYPAMYGKPDSEKLDPLVKDSAEYFKRREEALLGT